MNEVSGDTTTIATTRSDHSPTSKRKRGVAIPKKELAKLESIIDNYCPNCQSKIRTDLMGLPVCPIRLDSCPRNNR
jgi:hypothetical protein